MPILSAFHGIVIRMYYQEHEPPHFHAEHRDQQGKFDFDGSMLAGKHSIGQGAPPDSTVDCIAPIGARIELGKREEGALS